MKKAIKGNLFEIINYILITLLCISILYPIWLIVANSINGRIANGYCLLFPEVVNFKSYKSIFMDDDIFKAFLMSCIRTVVGIIAALLNCSLCAYVLRKKDIMFRKFYIVLFTIPMFFSGGLIPTYLNYRMVGLVDNFLVYIVPNVFVFFYVIILMSCFSDIPAELEESAKIDGARHLTILIRIYMPIMKPVLATIALFIGVFQWNSWFDTVYFTNSPKLSTLAEIMVRIVTKNSVAKEMSKLGRNTEELYANVEGIKFATMVVSILPIIFIYPFLQRYFVKGLMIGSIKA